MKIVRRQLYPRTPGDIPLDAMNLLDAVDLILNAPAGG